MKAEMFGSIALIKTHVAQSCAQKRAQPRMYSAVFTGHGVYRGKRRLSSCKNVPCRTGGVSPSPLTNRVPN